MKVSIFIVDSTIPILYLITPRLQEVVSKTADEPEESQTS